MEGEDPTNEIRSRNGDREMDGAAIKKEYLECERWLKDKYADWRKAFERN